MQLSIVFLLFGFIRLISAKRKAAFPKNVQYIVASVPTYIVVFLLFSAVKFFWFIKRSRQIRTPMGSQQQTWQSTTDTMNVPDISVLWRKM